ncbi:hypothetical protein [Aquabacterium sp.]|uniref:hypothetical protein n=1 Tax=Aquabacterium sp. TaxID=1872578 RepID=UPI0035AEACE7
MSDTVMALTSALILAIALTANFFVAAWRLNLIGIFERSVPLSWRQVVAGAVAAALPWIGAYAAMTLAGHFAASRNPADLAVSCAALGYGLSRVMDVLVDWGNQRAVA